MDGNNSHVGTAGTVTLTDNASGKSFEFPVIEGSIGPKVIDIRKLYAQTGYFTYAEIDCRIGWKNRQPKRFGGLRD